MMAATAGSMTSIRLADISVAYSALRTIIAICDEHDTSNTYAGNTGQSVDTIIIIHITFSG